MGNMKFDIKKWENHVETVGIDVLLSSLANNPIFKNWYCIHTALMDRFFDPLLRSADYGILTALGLDINDFLYDGTITGVEALRALADGKTLVLFDDEYTIIDGELNVFGPVCDLAYSKPQMQTLKPKNLLHEFIKEKFTIKQIDTDTEKS